MGTPAGWYDDGSGRQRWWDGERWTDLFAPPGGHGGGPEASSLSGGEASFGSAGAPVPYVGAPGSKPGPVGPQRSSVLGFVGLGLAVLGTVLACIPTAVTFPTGIVLLLAAFVVSLVAVFQKGTRKWPSITGIILSVVGGVIGGIVFATVLWFGSTETADHAQPVPDPPPMTSEQPTEDSPQPSEEPTQPSEEPSESDSDGRPSPEAIGEGMKALHHEGGVTMHDGVPGFYPCLGQHFYDSELSDETLRTAAEGKDLTGPDRETAIEIGTEGTLACDPNL